jgi:hypothetical protein
LLAHASKGATGKSLHQAVKTALSLRPQLSLPADIHLEGTAGIEVIDQVVVCIAFAIEGVSNP